VTIDAYFGLADERLFHLEFQTEYYGATLPRYLAYNGYLYKRYRRSIATVVCCSGGLNVARVRDQGGTIQDCVADVLMGERDGAETDRRRDRLARSPRVVGVWPRPSISRPYWQGAGGRYLPRFPLGAWAVGRSRGTS